MLYAPPLPSDPPPCPEQAAERNGILFLSSIYTGLTATFNLTSLGRSASSELLHASGGSGSASPVGGSSREKEKEAAAWETGDPPTLQIRRGVAIVWRRKKKGPDQPGPVCLC